MKQQSGKQRAAVGLAMVAAMAIGAGAGCSEEGGPGPVTEEQLARRAYVVSLSSDELAVIDLDSMELIARVATGGINNHMAELSNDFREVYVSSPETNEVIVVDAVTLTVVKRISVGAHPTHMSINQDGLLAVMAEDAGVVSFIDTATDEEIKRLPGFETPHFMRFAPDGKYGYVANIGAHHITQVDLATLSISDEISLDGFAIPAPVEGEGGFGDAQIAADGTLYAAHASTGKVLVYDTVARAKVTELEVGERPWIVFAEHPFADLPLRHLVPSFGDRTVAIIDGEKVGGAAPSVSATLPGDEEAYGVNFSSLTPERAFVMNRVREDVAIVDTGRNEIVGRIPVGGNTETAATSADGRWIVAAVSSANKVVVIDPETAQIATELDGLGLYPWSVTIPRGQNYCH
jgi:YVTN family beta-propeller protein